MTENQNCRLLKRAGSGTWFCHLRE